MSSYHLPRLRMAALSAALVLLVTSCGSDDGQPSSESAGATPTAVVPSPTETPSSPPVTSTPTTAPSPQTLADRLLQTEQVPGFNPQWEWQDGETGPAGADAFGLCATVDLASIGATEVVERTYFPPVDVDDSAAQQVADFPDQSTAARALSVLKSWHRKCKSQISEPRLKIGNMISVPVENGTGSWYLVRYADGPDEARFHAFGIAASDTRITVLRIDNGGQDYNYSVGEEPMVAMVQAAAAKLG